MEYIREILAKNLLDTRKAQGLTQVQLADLINVTAASYNRWEKGINWPDPESIEKIASYYKIPSSSFFQDSSLLTPPNSPNALKDALIKDLESVLSKYKS